MDIYFCCIENNLWPIQRSLEQSEIYVGQQINKGYARPPLIRIEPTSCPPDHLHMRKGIIGKLFTQVS